MDYHTERRQADIQRYQRYRDLKEELRLLFLPSTLLTIALGAGCIWFILCIIWRATS